MRILQWGLLTLGFFLSTLLGNVQAQELLLNPGFENWDNVTELPLSWGAPVSSVKETAIQLDGNAALKIGPVNMGLNGRVYQEIPLPTTTKVGDIYEFIINYNVVTSVNGNDLKITSSWQDVNYDPIQHNVDLLDNGTLFTSVGTWGQKKFRVTVPNGAKRFNFRVQAQTGVTVIYDDFSFKKVSSTDPDVPTLSTQPSAIPGFISSVGQQQVSPPIAISGINLMGDISLKIEGLDAVQFKVSATNIQQSVGSGNITVTYQPTADGSHSATLKISSAGATAISIPLIGSTGVQKQLLSNPGFETASSNMFGVTFEDWSFPLGGAKIEAIDKIEGKQSFKANESNASVNILEQEITSSVNNFMAGETYEMIIRYKVLTSQSGMDIKVMSFWESPIEGPLAHDSILLNNEQFFTSDNWVEKRIKTTVPKGATKFQFRVGVAKKVQCLFDDFSFMKVETPIGTDPVLEVSSLDLISLSTTINTPKNSSPLTITTANLPNDVTLEITGSGAAHFNSTVTRIPTTSRQTAFMIVYNPKSAGNHEATLTIDCKGAEILSKTITLRGSASDPSEPPVISVAPSMVPSFKTKVGTDSVYTIQVTSSNLTDYLYLSVSPGGKFTINSTMLPKNSTSPVNITFRSMEVGTFNASITLRSKDAVDVVIPLTGEAIKGDTPEPEEFERVLAPMVNENPLTLLNEKFDTITHNKTLKLKGWRNVVPQGERGWWGFDHKDGSGKVMEKSAKATAYIYQQPVATPYEMWLITPPLDFKNASSKVFTFRVMGDFMFDNHPAQLELYYMDQPQGEELYMSKVEMPMPSIADENGDWREYHINLEGQNIADVFFMGFKYTGPSGQENAVVYYIDDVSFGRTDLPVLSVTPTETQILETNINTTKTGNTISVSGRNITQPIEIKVDGPNASKFKPSVVALPVTGGSFTITFEPKQVGIHEAYVLVSSRGAADILIPLVGRATDPSSTEVIMGEPIHVWQQRGSLFVSTKAEGVIISVLDLNGRTLHQERKSDLQVSLQQGAYMVKVSSEKGSVVHKVMID